MVERVNSLGTMRLFALKDWAAIRNASAHVRALGQELNSVLSRWLDKRMEIGKRFQYLDKKKDKIEKLEDKIAQSKAKRFSLGRLLTIAPEVEI